VVAVAGAIGTAALALPALPGPRLVTNEYAHRHPSAPGAVLDRDWDVTSGSLFARDGAWWTGRPDDARPGADSAAGTDSAVFRATTRRRDFGDATVSFKLRVHGWVTTARSPARAWDGVHILLRYQSPQELYYASIDRRDGSTQVKKKVAGGPSNGGTYYTLATGAPTTEPTDRAASDAWLDVAARVATDASGRVTISLYRADRLVLEAVDDGRLGGPPIRSPGAVGIRGDNCEFEFRAFTVDALDGGPGLALAGPSG
jgi:hypothetical protein